MIGWAGVSYCLGEARDERKQEHLLPLWNTLCSHLSCTTHSVSLHCWTKTAAQIHPYFWFSNATGHWSVLPQSETSASQLAQQWTVVFWALLLVAGASSLHLSSFPVIRHPFTTAFIGTCTEFSVSGPDRVPPSKKVWFKPLASLVILHHFMFFCLWAETVLKFKWLHLVEVQSWKISRIY